ncbi:MAG: tail fiber domain-containing protein [Bacteroidales bacterium]
MKKRILFMFILLSVVATTICHAQIKVISGGNVGIGIDNPAEKLQINGSVRGNQSGALRISSGNGNVDVGAKNTSFAHFYTSLSRYYFDKIILLGNGRLSSYSTTNLQLCTGHSPENVRMTISASNGNVGIGLSPSNSYRLYMNGIVAATAFQVTSDIRLKENIKPMDKSFNKIELLQPITFQFADYIDKNSKISSVDSTGAIISAITPDKSAEKKTRFGFSAQEVQKIFPDLVMKDDNGYLSVDYIGLIPVLVEALKEQQMQIDELEKKVLSLTGKSGIR